MASEILLGSGPCSLFGLLYLAQIGFFFFDEFDACFNLIGVDYLICPREVLTDIWESYPVIWVLLVDSVISLLLFRWIMPWKRWAAPGHAPPALA